MKFLLALLLLAPLLPTTQPRQFGAEPNKLVYQSKQLTITQVAPNTFVHTSFLNTNTYGRVPCNGLVVRNAGEAVVFDTPATDPEAKELLAWITKDLHCRVNAVVPTHFHEDCVGGLREFERRKIPSYANKKTITLARQAKAHVPQHGFTNSLTLNVGGAKVYAAFLGEGHTPDNVVGYFPTDDVLFGGCLVKELNAGKGNLADANVQAWPTTVEKLKQAYPNARVVVPGHGEVGDQSLLDYTIRLFK